MSEPARTSEARSHSADAACMTLLDLVAAVAEEAESDEEILLVVSDLIRSGKIRLVGNFRASDVQIG